MTWLLGALLAMLLAALWWCWRMSERNRALVAENERWRAMARQRADQVSMLSHELRTPMALVRGSAELLGDQTAGSLDALQLELVETIASNSDRMSVLAEDLLVDAQIDAGLFSLRMVMVDVRRLVVRVVRDVRRLEQVPIHLECRGAPPRVPADPGLLRQVVVNLLNNAIRHAGPGAEVSVRVRATEGQVLLSVSDTGAGMSERTRRAVFGREPGAKSETGHGLGMVISKRIVEMHGGRMMLDTISGHGTTVTIALPDATVADSLPEHVPAEAVGVS